VARGPKPRPASVSSPLRCPIPLSTRRAALTAVRPAILPSPDAAKPVVTFFLLSACFVLHFFLAEVNRFLPFNPSIIAQCVNPAAIWYDGEVRRLLWAGFLHADDAHIYYNMLSLMWKGGAPHTSPL
jgi:membrane associated rhomboid family serine protease